MSGKSILISVTLQTSCLRALTKVTHFSAGSAWKKVDGKLVWISSGSSGKIWGTNKEGNILKREGVTQANPVGSSWEEVPGELAKVSVWETQVWGVKENNKVVFTVLPGRIQKRKNIGLY